MRNLRLLFMLLTVLASTVYYRSLRAENNAMNALANLHVDHPWSPILPKNIGPNWKIPICFLVAVYGQWAAHVDKLQNVEKLPFYNDTDVSFLAFTNLPNLNTKGWQRVLRKYPQYQRYVTQSRYPKFLGWKDPIVKDKCEVVFYMDAIGHITGNLSDFQEVAHAILQSEPGHAQYLHKGGGGAFGEFRRIEVFQKDLDANIKASKKWLSEQPDFSNNCSLYENRYIGYAVNSTSFHQAANFFWSHFSLEQDSWRDQPLWCYVLDRFNITPIPLDHKRLWKLKPRRMGKHGHKYGSEQ